MSCKCHKLVCEEHITRLRPFEEPSGVINGKCALCGKEIVKGSQYAWLPTEIFVTLDAIDEQIVENLMKRTEDRLNAKRLVSRKRVDFVDVLTRLDKDIAVNEVCQFLIDMSNAWEQTELEEAVLSAQDSFLRVIKRLEETQSVVRRESKD